MEGTTIKLAATTMRPASAIFLIVPDLSSWLYVALQTDDTGHLFTIGLGGRMFLGYAY